MTSLGFFLRASVVIFLSLLTGLNDLRLSVVNRFLRESSPATDGSIDSPPEADKHAEHLAEHHFIIIQYMTPNPPKHDARPIVIGDYRLHEKIGSGSFGIVYRAVHIKTGQWVAVKRMSFSRDRKGSSGKNLLEKERLILQLQHPNIVRGIDSFYEEDKFGEIESFLVMEWLDGMDLKQTVQHHGRLPLDRSIIIFTACANALAYATGQGIIHRDIKPSNIFLCATGEIKLLDFGIGRLEKVDASTAGVIPGALDYMAPDLFLGLSRRGDVQSDIFSLGVCFYETLTGQLPFRNRDFGATDTERFLGYCRWAQGYADVAADFSPEPCQRYPAVVGFIRRCLMADRESRFKSFAEVKQAVESLAATTSAVGIPADSPPQRTVGNYRLLERMETQGNYAHVWVADHLDGPGKKVVLKILRDAFHEPEHIRRFADEAKLLQRLSECPNIVQFHDYITIPDSLGHNQYCIVLEYLTGQTLTNRLREYPDGAPIPTILKIFRCVAVALRFAHRQHIVHRDVKPDNIVCLDGDRAKLIDFGIAREANEVKTSGGIKGALNYMAPDYVLLQNDFHGDALCDIYSFGVCFYRGLVGKLPYPALEGNDLSIMIEFVKRAGELAQLPVDWSHPVFVRHPELRTLVQGCMHPDRGQRPATLDGVVAALDALIGASAVAKFPGFIVQETDVNGIAAVRDHEREGKSRYRLLPLDSAEECRRAMELINLRSQIDVQTPEEIVTNAVDGKPWSVFRDVATDDAHRRLSDLLSHENPLTVFALVAQVLRALKELHRLGQWHGNLQRQHILVRDSGPWFLMPSLASPFADAVAAQRADVQALGRILVHGLSKPGSEQASFDAFTRVRVPPPDEYCPPPTVQDDALFTLIPEFGRLLAGMIQGKHTAGTALAVIEAMESRPESGRRLQGEKDAYEFMEIVDRGGCGVVYKIRRLRDGKMYAGKCAQQQFSQTRFNRELMKLKSFVHPNIVSYVDEAVDTNPFRPGVERLYLIMEYLHGQSLKAMLEPGRKESANSFRLAARSPSSLTSEKELQGCGGRACREPGFSSDVMLGSNSKSGEIVSKTSEHSGAVTPAAVEVGVSQCSHGTMCRAESSLPAGTEEATRHFARMARLFHGFLTALDYCHKRGVIHRDIKPGNLFVADGDVPVLLDFGIIRDGRGTETVGSVPGTFEYMAPEFGLAAAPFRGDARSDVFSMGLCLFEAICGQPAFAHKLPLPASNNLVDCYKAFVDRARSLDGTADRWWTSQLPASIPDDLVTVFVRALHPQPQSRYDSAQAFAEALVVLIQPGGCLAVEPALSQALVPAGVATLPVAAATVDTGTGGTAATVTTPGGSPTPVPGPASLVVHAGSSRPGEILASEPALSRPNGRSGRLAPLLVAIIVVAVLLALNPAIVAAGWRRVHHADPWGQTVMALLERLRAEPLNPQYLAMIEQFGRLRPNRISETLLGRQRFYNEYIEALYATWIPGQCNEFAARAESVDDFAFLYHSVNGILAHSLPPGADVEPYHALRMAALDGALNVVEKQLATPEFAPPQLAQLYESTIAAFSTPRRTFGSRSLHELILQRLRQYEVRSLERGREGQSGVFAAANASEELGVSRKGIAEPNSARQHSAVATQIGLESYEKHVAAPLRWGVFDIFSTDVELPPRTGVLLHGTEPSRAPLSTDVSLTETDFSTLCRLVLRIRAASADDVDECNGLLQRFVGAWVAHIAAAIDATSHDAGENVGASTRSRSADHPESAAGAASYIGQSESDQRLNSVSTESFMTQLAQIDAYARQEEVDSAFMTATGAATKQLAMAVTSAGAVPLPVDVRQVTKELEELARDDFSDWCVWTASVRAAMTKLQSLLDCGWPAAWQEQYGSILPATPPDSMLAKRQWALLTAPDNALLRRVKERLADWRGLDDPEWCAWDFMISGVWQATETSLTSDLAHEVILGRLFAIEELAPNAAAGQESMEFLKAALLQLRATLDADDARRVIRPQWIENDKKRIAIAANRWTASGGRPAHGSSLASLRVDEYRRLHPSLARGWQEWIETTKATVSGVYLSDQYELTSASIRRFPRLERRDRGDDPGHLPSLVTNAGPIRTALLRLFTEAELRVQGFDYSFLPIVQAATVELRSLRTVAAANDWYATDMTTAITRLGTAVLDIAEWAWRQHRWEQLPPVDEIAALFDTASPLRGRYEQYARTYAKRDQCAENWNRAIAAILAWDPSAADFYLDAFEDDNPLSNYLFGGRGLVASIMALEQERSVRGHQRTLATIVEQRDAIPALVDTADGLDAFFDRCELVTDGIQRFLDEDDIRPLESVYDFYRPGQPLIDGLWQLNIREFADAIGATDNIVDTYIRFPVLPQRVRDANRDMILPMSEKIRFRIRSILRSWDNLPSRETRLQRVGELLPLNDKGIIIDEDAEDLAQELKHQVGMMILQAPMYPVESWELWVENELLMPESFVTVADKQPGAPVLIQWKQARDGRLQNAIPEILFQGGGAALIVAPREVAGGEPSIVE